MISLSKYACKHVIDIPEQGCLILTNQGIQTPIFISYAYNIRLGCEIKLRSAHFIAFHVTQQS